MNFNKTVAVLSEAVKNLSDYNNGSLSGQELREQFSYEPLKTALDLVSHIWHQS